jgi:hypothetical protein
LGSQGASKYGNDTSRNAGVLICGMSQKRWNESYSLWPHGPPFTDISCGFFLTLSLTHSIERRRRRKTDSYIGVGKKKRK